MRDRLERTPTKACYVSSGSSVATRTDQSGKRQQRTLDSRGTAVKRRVLGKYFVFCLHVLWPGHDQCVPGPLLSLGRPLVIIVEFLVCEIPTSGVCA